MTERLSKELKDGARQMLDVILDDGSDDDSVQSAVNTLIEIIAPDIMKELTRHESIEWRREQKYETDDGCATRFTELHQAFFWVCEDCGVDNFIRAIQLEMDEESEIELREEHGISPWERGNLCMVPSYVTCSHCKAEYRTSEEGE